MATNFTRPTFAQIFARVQSDIEGELTGVTARLRRTAEYALAFAQAGVSHTLHAHIAWVAEQILPDTMAERFVLRFGGLLGIPRKAASAAQRVITVTGTGGTLPATTQWVRAGNGALLTVDTTVATIASAAASITAVVAGTAANLTVGESITLVSPIAGVSSVAVVASITVDGTDLESLTAYLGRILDQLRNPPMGGAPGDYEQWALQVPGVTRAWEYAGKDGVGNLGLGKVSLTFVRDNDLSIIPDSGEVAVVQAYVQAKAPAEFLAFAPTSTPFNYTVALTPNTVETQQAVENEVADLLKREAVPGGTLAWSRINEAISAAEGEFSHVLTIPAADVVYAFGAMPVYGTATFV